MSGRAKTGAILVTVILIGAAIGFWLSSLRTAPRAQIAPALPSPAPAVSSSPVASVVITAARADERAWLAFRDQFGANLLAEFAADGSLSAIRGAPGKGAKAESVFRSGDASAVQDRAREILAAASGLLGLNPDFPLGDPVTRVGLVSAQVHFRETWRGMPLEPSGSVVVDLGSQGELLNLSSDYVRDLRVTGERRLSPSDAKAQAEAAVTVAELPTSGGRPVVWVTRGRPGEPSAGRQAYDYDVGGRQVVVDAETGKILFSRDRRQY